ncbi:hypothetical protein INR49_025326 [Caranx melampygus]|nr:hypothetical protein INR49_025326 [Caranx melampygus]
MAQFIMAQRCDTLPDFTFFSHSCQSCRGSFGLFDIKNWSWVTAVLRGGALINTAVTKEEEEEGMTLFPSLSPSPHFSFCFSFSFFFTSTPLLFLSFSLL